jgi:uncharacterized membrane protein YtjA (UPF0391 family)
VASESKPESKPLPLDFRKPGAKGQKCLPNKLLTTLSWNMIILVMALTAAVFGFGDIAAGVAEIAKAVLYPFLGVVVITLFVGIEVGRKLIDS